MTNSVALGDTGSLSQSATEHPIQVELIQITRIQPVSAVKNTFTQYFTDAIKVHLKNVFESVIQKEVQEIVNKLLPNKKDHYIGCVEVDEKSTAIAKTLVKGLETNLNKTHASIQVDLGSMTKPAQLQNLLATYPAASKIITDAGFDKAKVPEFFAGFLQSLFYNSLKRRLLNGFG